MPSHTTKFRSKPKTAPKTTPSATQTPPINLSIPVIAEGTSVNSETEIVQEPKPNNVLDAETDNIHSPDIATSPPTLLSSIIHVTYIFQSLLTSFDTQTSRPNFEPQMTNPEPDQH
jgi:hypothetical protein